jgi:hypothetical protein
MKFESDYHVVITDVRDKLSVSKQSRNFIGKFSLNKLSTLAYQLKATHRFVTFKNLDDSVEYHSLDVGIILKLILEKDDVETVFCLLLLSHSLPAPRSIPISLSSFCVSSLPPSL